MTKKERRMEWYKANQARINPGSIKPSSYRRTEGNLKFEYSNKVANAFSGWSTPVRDSGIEPLFKDFYDQLEPRHQQEITVISVTPADCKIQEKTGL